eukprot:6890496-Pyramimonas_sp.AAC.1
MPRNQQQHDEFIERYRNIGGIFGERRGNGRDAMHADTFMTKDGHQPILGSGPFQRACGPTGGIPAQYS